MLTAFQVGSGLLAIVLAVVALIYAYHARMRVNSKLKAMQTAVVDMNTAVRKVEKKAEEFTAAMSSFRDEVKELQVITEEEVRTVRGREILS